VLAVISIANANIKCLGILLSSVALRTRLPAVVWSLSLAAFAAHRAQPLPTLAAQTIAWYHVYLPAAFSALEPR
jgi:hypothetical protein